MFATKSSFSLYLTFASSKNHWWAAVSLSMNRGDVTVAALVRRHGDRGMYNELALYVAIIYFMTSSGQRQKASAQRMALKLKRNRLYHMPTKEMKLCVHSGPLSATFILGSSITQYYFQ